MRKLFLITSLLFCSVSYGQDYEILNKKSKQEIIRVPKKDNPDEFVEKYTGDFVFENNWQSFRTKEFPELELTSIAKKMSKNVTTIAVKVVDIFGNDTMKIIKDIKL